MAPWLLLGPALPSAEYAALREDGVTHIVDLRAEASDDGALLAEAGLRWFHLPIPDRFPPTGEQLEQLLDWLQTEGVDEDGEHALLLHCQAGLTRTPTVAMALLMHRGYTLSEAHRLVFAARPEVALSPAQLEWLEGLAGERAAGGSG